jgi:hypothetical protein
MVLRSSLAWKTSEFFILPLKTKIAMAESYKEELRSARIGTKMQKLKLQRVTWQHLSEQ